ncbi:hypothetical protein FACS1894202_03610 [Clostridia bacterium]|nr:hypothetical protein FACS1894202_03610 [Clostridia bacterium]
MKTKQMFKRTTAFALTALMLFGLLPTLAPITAFAASTVVDDLVLTLTNAGLTAVYSEAGRPTVTVTGGVTGATETLNLTLPGDIEDFVVDWQADYSGNVNSGEVYSYNASESEIAEYEYGVLINLIPGEGEKRAEFIVSGGSLYNTDTVIYANGKNYNEGKSDHVAVTISGGMVKNAEDSGTVVGIYAETLNITGGEVALYGGAKLGDPADPNPLGHGIYVGYNGGGLYISGDADVTAVGAQSACAKSRRKSCKSCPNLL